MKPAWDALMADYKDHPTKLVADVDCTAAGKPLCDANGVKGFPTLKWGDPTDLQDYEGGRTMSDLKKFAEENLKPQCSVANMALCDEAKKAQIEKYLAMSEDDLKAAVAAEEEKMADAEEHFKTEVQKLQDTYQKLNEEKDKIVADVKGAGLGLMKSVLNAPKKAGSDEL